MSSPSPSAPLAEPGTEAAAHAFIAKWRQAGGSELANAQSFVIELCELLGVERPAPAVADAADNAYAFERGITFQHPDGHTSAGRIDLYRRGCFVLESKKVKLGPATKGFDDALMKARTQAEAYARALPASEGRPPFVVVVDVGHVIELYAEFTRSGGVYTAFPDARNHRIPLERLAEPAVRARLRQLWLEPMALDPSRRSAQVTREVAAKLAQLARDLEGEGHGAERVAAFLTRCLFSMFAEDVGLLPQAASGAGAFVHLLRTHAAEPDTLRQMLRLLWTDMDRGGFSGALAKPVLRFNGKLFKGSAQDDYVLPLTKRVIQGLLAAAQSDWRHVEPAIIGTLLERALDPAERHALGAHYTPRAYVERLVLPTVVEPLRADWADAEAAALLLATEAEALDGKKREDKLAEARAQIRRFHHQLCTTRVLDPACGSGNFLYVTLEHLKRLEGEVLDRLDALGDTQGKLGLEGETVTPRQLLGIEINERAAALAELVLWIGYLQWHLRTLGSTSVAEPVIHDYGNIEHRDAVLAYDGMEPLRDAAGALVTRWDGKTFKTHPATGEPVPDEAAQVAQWRYLNPRPAVWPEAEFIVGNPPFIGNKRMREALGDGYVEALRGAWQDVPDTADFVVYWWDRSARLVRDLRTRRFGLITTNSIKQTFNRKVLSKHLEARPPLRLLFAIPDHPWVDGSNGAAVRIAMTVGALDVQVGEHVSVTTEETGAFGEVETRLAIRKGLIHSDLAVGADVASARKLAANAGICYQGFVLVGEGFILSAEDALRLEEIAPSEAIAVRPWKNGRDLSQGSRGHSVVDLFPLDQDGARSRFPFLYQHLADRVKPFRDQVARRAHRERWWIWGEARPGLRRAVAGQHRVVVTNFAAKHRYFVFESPRTALDHNMYVIATEDAWLLGTLSSVCHLEWMLRAGSTLGKC
ncbi:MAG: class I SAM-dependent DNA methyltransferase [Rubrivivax sp.]|nr:class I SAM-dependent DNA methyltransferase [Rubrivivax sp.]